MTTAHNIIQRHLNTNLREEVMNKSTECQSIGPGIGEVFNLYILENISKHFANNKIKKSIIFPLHHILSFYIDTK